MPVSIPPPEAIREFLGETTRHTRRIEIYESDGTTRWEKDTVNRLKEGTISVDYDRDERRGLDLTLSNDDGVLVNAPGELWYDKVIKVFRGVKVNQKSVLPRVLIISDKTGGNSLAANMRQMIVGQGYGDVRINVLASDYDVHVAPFDIIIALGNATTEQIDLLKTSYLNGKSVFVLDADVKPFLNSMFSPTFTSRTPDSVEPNIESSHPVAKGWDVFPAAFGSSSIDVPNLIDDSSSVVGYSQSDHSRSRVIALTDQASAGRAVTLSLSVINTQFESTEFARFIASAMNWLNVKRPITEWEVQIGEFMIDRISEPHFPREVRITGRDYTKKCMNSKFTQATQFEAGMKLEEIIGAIAGAAGIIKRALPVTDVMVGRTFFYDRNTSRWDALKEIANSYNYEIFFDATGCLVIRPFNDPALTAPTVWIETGPEGVLASYEKSTSDSRLFNHVLVTGESSESDRIPVWAERINSDPASSTSVYAIGDRLYVYSSPFIETQTQADSLADIYLKLYGLEEFSLSFDSLVLPWLEVGDIIGWIDPNPAPDDPNTFLLSSLNIPLGLSPMSASAKRVTIVEA